MEKSLKNTSKKELEAFYKSDNMDTHQEKNLWTIFLSYTRICA
ncbi:hypothetical protein [Oceanobacillus chungangensis]|nr:hypothetical protein [Oceanobacillus chungangensis]